MEEILFSAKLKHLIISNCILDNISPGRVYTQSFNISEYNTKIFCSWKTDIYSSKIANKTYSLPTIFLQFFIPHNIPGTNCTEYNNIFLSTLERINSFNFTFFIFSNQRLKIWDLLTIWRDYTNVLITSGKICREIFYCSSLYYISEWFFEGWLWGLIHVKNNECCRCNFRLFDYNMIPVSQFLPIEIIPNNRTNIRMHPILRSKNINRITRFHQPLK